MCTVKSGSFKDKPTLKLGRSYKSFNIDCFKNILHKKLSNLPNTCYKDFEETILNLQNKHAPHPQPPLSKKH